MTDKKRITISYGRTYSNKRLPGQLMDFESLRIDVSEEYDFCQEPFEGSRTFEQEETEAFNRLRDMVENDWLDRLKKISDEPVTDPRLQEGESPPAVVEPVERERTPVEGKKPVAHINPYAVVTKKINSDERLCKEDYASLCQLLTRHKKGKGKAEPWRMEELTRIPEDELVNWLIDRGLLG